jgi:ABC-type uncharacterized transport system involved in gliding motility auxiliary subunit
MKKADNKLIWSVAGAVIVLLTVIALNVLGTVIFSRLDLTREKNYTLSEGAQEVLDNLKYPVVIRYYCSRSNNLMPVALKNYASRVEDLLNSFKQAGKGKLIIEKYDPTSVADNEENAELDGIYGQSLSSGDKLYFGLAVSCLDKTESIAFLTPQKEGILEYDIARAIKQVSRDKMKTIGVMSVFPVLGSDKPSQAMLAQGKYALEQPWFSMSELKRDFNLKTISMQTVDIDKNIDLLLIIHPAGITEQTQFAIDQFVLRGGRLVVFLDPHCFLASLKAQQDQTYRKYLYSTLDKLLPAWGINYNPLIVSADMKYAKRIINRERRSTFPAILELTSSAMNKENVLTAKLEMLSLWFAGAFAEGENIPKDIQKTILVHGSKDSAPVNTYVVQKTEMLLRNFKPKDQLYDLAVLLKGKFKTAFEKGPPEGINKKRKYLKKAKKESKIVVVADVDMLVNDVCVAKSATQTGKRYLLRPNDNVSFLQNLLEYMCDDSKLIDTRCREVQSRPFDKINEVRSKAEQEFKDRIVELEKELLKTQGKLNQLQKRKDNSQQLIFSPEQLAEIQKFKEEQIRAQKDLKSLKKQLRKDIDLLENRLKLINILLVPLLVIILGVVLAFFRKKRSSAK